MEGPDPYPHPYPHPYPCVPGREISPERRYFFVKRNTDRHLFTHIHNSQCNAIMSSVASISDEAAAATVYKASKTFEAATNIYLNLEHANWTVRMEALNSLKQHDVAKHISVVIERLGDDDSSVRTAACEALTRGGRSLIVQNVKTIGLKARTANHPEVKLRCLEVLSQLDGEVLLDARVMATLNPLLADHDAAVRGTATQLKSVIDDALRERERLAALRQGGDELPPQARVVTSRQRPWSTSRR
jgi:HEAT repeat protein